MQGLDAIDILILKTLQEDAKLTTKELAQIVGLSASPVFERLKRLERRGYIRKYVAVLDANKVGNGIIVMCNIRLKQHGQDYADQFMDAIMQLEEVTECYNTSGEYDFLIKIYVRDMQHYQDFVLHTLGRMECVGSLHSVFVIGEVKCTNAVPLPPVEQIP
ncbi:Lrp/AsnC family transcriptional regulator [Porphyromonas sp. COT-239 OH1446]|uniref:Lrp/AsnC family transcriptional regulator n=1 Tax=Porphyromonas sp. COT-239 OH1446 TaxID=1515613 RepID=UPI00052C1FE2|nr:Lrp/AsnC family transcriptional regulator [Porphyromonas sp. COT-239 OH1446]KGN70119.1 AsnC family transcriptional regulator [Porphyromonas sp. COT-239 OH1446]